MARGSWGTIYPCTGPHGVESGGFHHILCGGGDHHSCAVVWHNICSGADMFWQGCCRCQSGLAPHPAHSLWDKWGQTSHPHSC